MAKSYIKILLTIVATIFVTSLCFAQVNPYARALRGEKRLVSGGMLEKIDSAAIANPPHIIDALSVSIIFLFITQLFYR